MLLQNLEAESLESYSCILRLLTTSPGAERWPPCGTGPEAAVP